MKPPIPLEMMEEKLHTLLHRTALFHAAAQRHIQTLLPAPEPRFVIAFQSGRLSLEHGGLRPLSRTLTGYPAQLIYDVIRNSNAVVALAAQLQSILTGLPQNMEPVRQLHQQFTDVLPLLSQ